MSDHEDPGFEARLRRLLKPVDPPQSLESAVAAAIARAGGAARIHAGPGAVVPRASVRWRPALAAAATVTAAVMAGGVWLWSAHRIETERARQAGEQISIALLLASNELHGAFNLANRLSASDADAIDATQANEPGARAGRGSGSNSHD